MFRTQVMVLREAVGSLGKGQQIKLQSLPFPVPMKGVNALSAFSGLDPEEAHFMYNILPTEQGITTRLGTAEYSNDVGFAIRTMIGFVGKADDRSGDKLFATGDDGIYAVTSGATNVSKVFSFASANDSAGYGNYIQWTAANGAQFIQYADSVNGLLEYDAASNSWAAVTASTNITETSIRFVTVHKLRIWYLTEDNGNAFYLPINAKSGSATEFQLGSKYLNGGDTAGIFNLTQDSGDGLDDYYLAVSRAGDVLVYQGTDPSSASTWSLVGRYQVGEIPKGRKFGIEAQGDVMLLSANGLTSVKDLMLGVEAYESRRSPASKISNLIRSRMETELQTAGWEVMVYPTEGVLLIQSPERSRSTDRYLHYVFNFNTAAWGFWRDVKSLSMTMLRERIYYGDSEGSIWYMVDGEDNVTLAAPAADGTPVEFSLLTAYSSGGLPGQVKRCAVIKPIFRGVGLLGSNYQVLYDYEFEELPAIGLNSTSGAIWNTAKWDAALWVGSNTTNIPYSTLGGGIGVVMAVSLRGQSTGRMTLMEITAFYEPGGVM